MATEERDRLIDHLKRLHLRHAAHNLDDHLRDAARLKSGHLALLARIAEAEVLARKGTAAQKRIRAAYFPELCRLEDYKYAEQPCVDRKRVMDLGELGFLDRCESVLWFGPSGVGKTFLAIGLGVRACEAGYDVRFCRAFEMLRTLYASLADNTLDARLRELCEPDLLIVDEIGNSPRTPEQDFAAVFFELVARRYRHGSIVLTTNLGFDEWPGALGRAAQVTPALDRLLDAAHIFTFPKDAKSFRLDRKVGPGPLPPRRRARRRRRNGASDP
jgi:DNA replication protein DnaC